MRIDTRFTAFHSSERAVRTQYSQYGQDIVLVGTEKSKERTLRRQ